MKVRRVLIEMAIVWAVLAVLVFVGVRVQLYRDDRHVHDFFDRRSDQQDRAQWACGGIGTLPVNIEIHGIVWLNEDEQRVTVTCLDGRRIEVR